MLLSVVFYFVLMFVPCDAFSNRDFPAVTEIQDVDPNEVIDVKDSSQDRPFPNTYGPCPAGQVRHMYYVFHGSVKTFHLIAVVDVDRTG